MADAPPTTTLLLRQLSGDAASRAGPLLAHGREFAPTRPTDVNGHVYVLADVGAASDDEPLAAALVTWASEQDVVLAALAVLPHWRGQGLGGRLLAEVVDELRADGVRAVWAPVPIGDDGPSEDIASRGLFRSRGFLPSDTPRGWRSEPDVEWVSLEL